VEKAVEPPKPDIALERKKEIKKEPPKKPEPKLKLDRSKDIRAQLEHETAAVGQQLDKDRILDQMRREAATAAAKADDAYVGKLKGKIKSNIVLPPDIPGNPEAIFDVVQLPTGEVMSVKLRKSSGHKTYDEAVERAILKASPLPKPDRPEQFQRSLKITFKPLD
jgi:colicin import membrane protein